MTEEPSERQKLEDETNEAIENEARAAAEGVRAKRRTELLLAMIAVEVRAGVPTELKHVTVAAYAASRSISKATVLRYIDEGLPVIPVGSTVRVDPTAADEWRRARGRKPTTPESKKSRVVSESDVDVSCALAAGGLRAINGGR